MFWALGTLVALFWLYRASDDPVGEMVCDQDLFDDPGVDVDE